MRCQYINSNRRIDAHLHPGVYGLMWDAQAVEQVNGLGNKC